MLTKTDVLARSPERGRFSTSLCRLPAFEPCIPILILTVCFAYLCLFLRYSSLEPDEGIVLQGAERVLHGQLPYRDFFCFYTPGSFYLVALLFRIFGDSFAVARTSIAASGAICSAVTYLLSRRVCKQGTATFVAVLATVAGAAFRFLVLHNVFSTLFCCLAVYAGLRLVETGRSEWAFTSASLATLCFLVEQSKGSGLCLGLAVGLSILFLAGSVPLSRKSLLFLCVGMLWPLVSTFGFFSLHHTAELMVQSWLWPLQHYTQANHVPYGFQNWSDESRDAIFHTGPIWLRVVKIFLVSPDLALPILPLIAAAVGIYWACRVFRQRETSTNSSYYIFLGSVLSGLLVSVVVVRPDILHFIYLAPLWYVVLAWILGSATKNQLLSAARPYLFGYTMVAFGLLGMALLVSSNGGVNRIATRRGIITTGEKETVLSYLQVHSRPDEKLLVYPYLPLYNYLTRTSSPTRYDFFQPGMNSSEQAREIAESLPSSNIPILFEPRFPEKFANSWPDTPLSAIAKDPVADYIAENYRICAMLTSAAGWRFHYMVKKEVQCP